jgi:hypothetical protein
MALCEPNIHCPWRSRAKRSDWLGLAFETGKMDKRESHQVGGFATAAKYDLRVRGRRGSEAAAARLLDIIRREVDPDRSLPDDERERRVAAATKAYYARLAVASNKARKQRRKLSSVVAEDQQLLRLARALRSVE